MVVVVDFLVVSGRKDDCCCIGVAVVQKSEGALLCLATGLVSVVLAQPVLPFFLFPRTLEGSALS